MLHRKSEVVHNTVLNDRLVVYRPRRLNFYKSNHELSFPESMNIEETGFVKIVVAGRTTGAFVPVRFEYATICSSTGIDLDTFSRDDLSKTEKNHVDRYFYETIFTSFRLCL